MRRDVSAAHFQVGPGSSTGGGRCWRDSTGMPQRRWMSPMRKAMLPARSRMTRSCARARGIVDAFASGDALSRPSPLRGLSWRAGRCPRFGAGTPSSRPRLPRTGARAYYTWLYRIAVNNCKDFLRRRAVRPSTPLKRTTPGRRVRPLPMTPMPIRGNGRSAGAYAPRFSAVASTPEAAPRHHPPRHRGVPQRSCRDPQSARGDGEIAHVRGRRQLRKLPVTMWG